MRRAVIAFLITMTAASGTVRAQSLNYQPLPVGDRAVGMGGAFTGIAEDLSATWYNPGGLALQNGPTVSGALYLRLYDRYRVKDGYGFGDETSDLVAQGTLSTPFFVGGSAKVGDEEDPADRDHALGFTGLGPPVPTLRFHNASAPMDTIGGALNIVSSQSQQLYGPSYAYRINDRLGVGVSGYLSISNTHYDESEYQGVYGARNPDGSYSNSSLVSHSSGGNAEVFSLLFRFGALWKVRDDLNLGLMLQVPNIPLIRNGRIFENDAGVASDGTGVFAAADYQTTSAAPVPLELRLGVGYEPIPKLRLAFDFSFYGPIASEDDPIRVFGEAPVDPSLGRPPDAGRYYADGIYARPWFNVSVGMETIIADVVPISFGVFTDLAPTKPIGDAPTTTQSPTYINSVGLTGVIGIRSGGYNAAVGTAVVLGWGTTLGVDPTGGIGTYVPKSADTQAVYIFFTGYMQAAEQLAQDFEAVRLSAEEREARERESARLERLRQECEAQLAEELRERHEGSDSSNPEGADGEEDGGDAGVIPGDAGPTDDATGAQ